MGSIVPANGNINRVHAVCIPFMAQGHITPMLKLAKLLHQKGFYINIVNSEYNHRRFLKSRGPAALDGLPDFCFKTIPDGLPESAADATQDTYALCESTSKTCFEPFYELLLEINKNSGPESPPVSCIIADGLMCSFTLRAAEALGVPEVLLWTASACALLRVTKFKAPVEKGFVPLKDMNQLTNGNLETIVEWVPGVEDIRLRDIPTLIRTTNPEDFMLNFVIQEVNAMCRGSAVIINTYDTLEHEVVEALSPIFSCINTRLDSIFSNLWREDTSCLEWLREWHF